MFFELYGGVFEGYREEFVSEKSKMRFSAYISQDKAREMEGNAKFKGRYSSMDLIGGGDYCLYDLYLNIGTVINLNPNFPKTGVVEITSDEGIVWQFRVISDRIDRLSLGPGENSMFERKWRQDIYDFLHSKQLSG